jgi:hypothetical protein
MKDVERQKNCLQAEGRRFRLLYKPGNGRRALGDETDRRNLAPIFVEVTGPHLLAYIGEETHKPNLIHYLPGCKFELLSIP